MMLDVAAAAVRAVASRSGAQTVCAMVVPAAAVAADPAAILSAPTQMKIWPRASMGAYSLRAASVAAKKGALAIPARQKAIREVGSVGVSIASISVAATSAERELMRGSASRR